MIDVVYYNDKTRCFRNGVVERFLYGGYWCPAKNTANNYGGNRFSINNKFIQRHRLIAFCFLGLKNIIGEKNRSNSIDHINGNRLDNRVENLRIVSHQQNMCNQTKAKGYSWHKNEKKWQAKITVNGKNIYLGYFKTETEARQAYLVAKLIHHRI